MSCLSRYPALSALLIASPERAHALFGPLELALLAEGDVRIAQALAWFRAGAGGDLSDEAFLATVPEIPVSLLAHRDEFPFLTLVPWHIGNVEAAKMAKLKHKEYGYTNKTLVPVDKSRYGFPQRWEWIRAHDGTPNLGRKPSVCLAECTGPRYAGVDKVGIAIHLIHGARKHVMDLPASVHAGDRGGCACVNPFDDPRLGAIRGDGAGAGCGTVVFVLE